MNNVRNYRRGDIYLSKTGPRIGNRCSARAVLLLQNDADEFYSTYVFAVPIAMQPSPFPVPSENMLVYLTSMSLCSTAAQVRWTNALWPIMSARWMTSSLRSSVLFYRSTMDCSSPRRSRRLDEASKFARAVPGCLR